MNQKHSIVIIAILSILMAFFAFIGIWSLVQPYITKNNPTTFKDLREAKGFTLEDLSDSLGISETSLYKIEIGEATLIHTKWDRYEEVMGEKYTWNIKKED